MAGFDAPDPERSARRSVVVLQTTLADWAMVSRCEVVLAISPLFPNLVTSSPNARP